MSRVHPQGFRIASTSHRLVQTNQKSWCGTFSPQRFQYRLCRPPTDAEAPTMLEITELPYAKAIEAQRAPGVGFLWLSLFHCIHQQNRKAGRLARCVPTSTVTICFLLGFAALTQLFKCVLPYCIWLHLIYLIASCCILLHLIASWRKLKLGCFVVLSLKLLLTAWGSLPAPAPRGHSQCPSGHGHQYQHRGETFAAGIWHMGSLSQVGRATDGGTSLGGRDFEDLLLDLIWFIQLDPSFQ